MAQFLRPDADVSVGSWSATPLWSKLDEVTPSDADLVTSDNNTSPDTFEVGLTAPSGTPGAGTVTLRVRRSKSALLGHALQERFALFQGGTLVQELAQATPDLILWDTVSLVITNAITDWTDLRVRVSREGETGGGPSGRRSLLCSWIELEAPDASPGVLLSPDPVVATLAAVTPVVTVGGTDSASDDFSDAQTDSWGSLDVGGPWALTGVPADRFDKVGGRGVMTMTAGGQTANAIASLLGVLEQDVRVKVRSTQAAVGGTFQVFIPVRWVDNQNYLRAEVQFRVGGAIHGRLERLLGGAYTNLTGSEPQVSGLIHTADQDYWIRVEATGSNPTTLRMKVWQDGTSEPGAWHDSRTDSSAALQVASAAGLRAWSNAHTSFPMGIEWDDYGVNTGTSPPTVVAPDPVAAPLIVTTLAVTAGRVVGPDPVATVTVTAAPSASAATLISPNPVAAQLDAPVSSVTTGALATPGPVVSPLAIPIPTVSAGGSVTVSPTPIAVSTSEPGATISVGAVVALTPVASPLTVPAPSVSSGGSVTVSPDPTPTSTAAPLPLVSMGILLSPDTAAVLTSIPDPAVNAGGSVAVAPSPVAVSLDVAGPGVAVGVVLAPVPVATALVLPLGQVATGALLAPSAVPAMLGLLVSALEVGRVVDPDPVEVVVVTVAPGLTTGPLIDYPIAVLVVRRAGPAGSVVHRARGATVVHRPHPTLEVRRL